MEAQECHFRVISRQASLSWDNGALSWDNETLSQDKEREPQITALILS